MIGGPQPEGTAFCNWHVIIQVGRTNPTDSSPISSPQTRSPHLARTLTVLIHHVDDMEWHLAQSEEGHYHRHHDDRSLLPPRPTGRHWLVILPW